MRNRGMIIMVLVYALILILVGVFQPHEIDWRPTFSADDKIPFGTYILRERLTDYSPDSSIETVTKSIYQTLHHQHFSHTTYMLVEPRLSAGHQDVKELIRFAQEGNTVFIAARDMPYGLLDTLGIYTRYGTPVFIQKFTKKDTTSSLPISLINPAFAKDSVYEFETNNVPEFFSTQYKYNDDSEDEIIQDSIHPRLAKRVEVISTVSHEHPIFVKVPIGKGCIYLHSYPFAFSNYYLVKDSTRGYAENCLSYLPKGKILWDEHYKSDTEYRHTSTLGFILGSESLRWAYFSAAFFIILFVLFSIKRRQRIIPVVEPFRNTTLEFTETIGRLYYNRADHRNIAEKKIRHFLEYVRSRYYVDTMELNADFVSKLSSKSGVDKDRVQYMTEVMRSMLSKKNIADSELIQLNELIEFFKNNSN